MKIFKTSGWDSNDNFCSFEFPVDLIMGWKASTSSDHCCPDGQIMLYIRDIGEVVVNYKSKSIWAETLNKLRIMKNED